MRKLKSLSEFQNQGLELEKKTLATTIGGSDTSYERNTSERAGGDRERCCKEDNPNLQTSKNKEYLCVYI